MPFSLSFFILPILSIHRRHRRPAELCKQSDNGLLDKLIFFVGERAHERR